MRLLRLVIDNIASVEHAEIDFGGPLLGTEPLFLITGPTGAGKSTILDAISLALYNTTPRLEGAPAERFDDAAGGFRDKKGVASPVSVADPRMLMRRGSGQCAVQLTFAGDDGTVYTAEWGCARARGRADGRMQESTWRLRDAKGVELCARKADSRAELARLTGMTFEQFCRTTMLAQGAFARFLTSTADEKSRILERLTGTDIYSDISTAIYRRFKDEEETLDRLRERAGAITLLSDEERQALAARIGEIDAMTAALTGRREQAGRAIAAIAAVDAASARLDGARSTLAACEAERDSGPTGSLRRLVTDWDAGAEGRRIIADIAGEERRLKAASLRCADTAAWREAEDSLAALTLRIARRDAEATALRARIDSRRDMEPVMERCGELNSMAARRETVVGEEAHIASDTASRQKQIDAARRQAAELAVIVTDLTAEAAAQKQKLADTEAAEELRLLDSRQGEADATAARERELERARGLLTLLADRRAVASRSRERHSLLTEAEREAAGEVERLRPEAAAAAARSDEADDLYDRQNVALSDYLKALRAKLRQGDTCPLCGTQITSPAADSSFEALLKPLADARHKAHTERDAAAKALAGAEAALKERRRELPEAAKLLAADEKSAALARAEADADPCAAAFMVEGGDSVEGLRLIEAECAGLRQRAVALRTQIEAGRKLRDEADRYRRTLADNDRLRLETEKNMEALNARAVAEQSRIADNSERLLRLASERAALEQEMIRALPAGVWREAAQGGRYTEAVALLRAETERHRTDTAALAEADRELAVLRAAADGTAPLVEEVRRIHPGARPEAGDRGDYRKCLGLWQTLLADTRAALQKVTESESRIAGLRVRLDEITAAPGAVGHARIIELMGRAAEIEPARRRVAEADDRCKAASVAVAEALKVKEEAERALGTVTSDQLQTLRDEVAALTAEIESLIKESGEAGLRLRTDAEQRRAHTRTLEEIAAQQERTDRWGRLNEMFGSADGKRMRTIAQSYILAQLTVHANHYLSRLSRRYRLSSQPGQLTMLVEDLEAGGEIRPASSLSGGESFVVSLALALGLPALSGRAVAFDVIFIDEGFGTLDADTLSTVIETLGALHTLGGRRVGLISHVESLRERIAVQIRVTPEGGGRSAVEVTDACG